MKEGLIEGSSELLLRQESQNLGPLRVKDSPGNSISPLGIYELKVTFTQAQK